MKRVWFIPSFNGDIRLVQVTPMITELVVANPTPEETAAIGHFKEGVGDRLSVGADGKTLLCMSVGEAGGLLASLLSNGPSLTVSYSMHADVPVPVAVSEKPKEAKGDITVTTPVPAPTRSKPDCPETLASEVLHACLPPRLWKEWLGTGHITFHEGGEVYRLHHRKRHNRLCGEILSRGVDIAAALPFIPPPEEVLAFYHVLRYRTSWLLNARNIMEPETGHPHRRWWLFQLPQTGPFLEEDSLGIDNILGRILG